MKFVARKFKEYGDIKLIPVLSNSTTKTAFNPKHGLDKSFQEIHYRIDNWINKDLAG